MLFDRDMHFFNFMRLIYMENYYLRGQKVQLLCELMCMLHLQ